MKEFSDLNHLSRVQQNHSKSQTPVHCCLQLNYLGKTNVGPLLDAECKNDITRHNKHFKRTDGKYDGLLMRMIYS
jgi:hypothetical protein